MSDAMTQVCTHFRLSLGPQIHAQVHSHAPESASGALCAKPHEKFKVQNYHKPKIAHTAM
eukprot:5501490-Amphidinium_carterae.1